MYLHSAADMALLVSFEMTELFEGCAADTTGVGFLTGVCPLVSVEM